MTLKKYKVYHLDLKPDNVILTMEGWFRFIDFGLSETFEEEGVKLHPIKTLKKFAGPSLLKYIEEGKNSGEYDPFISELEVCQNIVRDLAHDLQVIRSLMKCFYGIHQI